MSRKTRLADILSVMSGDTVDAIESASGDVDELKGELESWLEGMPENLQGGQKADELQTAIDALETVKDALDEAQQALETASDEAGNVEFPGMFG